MTTEYVLFGKVEKNIDTQVRRPAWIRKRVKGKMASV